jgi:ABC-type Fe3+-hydroxamate transport system substrate-binding protein
MPVYTDQTGRTIELPAIPQRIVSLVPSQTELLYDMGLGASVVGITKFCVHPAQWFRNKTRVGGTKQIKMDILHELSPDLIIANKEENVKEQIQELETHYPVWISDVNDLVSAYRMIEDIGTITGREQEAEQIKQQIRKNFSLYRPPASRPSVAYLIWQKPFMTVGADTFIHAMLEKAGFDNVFADRSRYPEISIDELKSLKPQLLLLSSEPFPFKSQHVIELDKILPATRVLLVDGEMFSWYGSRLQQTPAYFAGLQKQAHPG